MKWTIRSIHVLAPLLLVGVLAGCSSGEERQAKYYESARELFESGDYPKAKLQLRNALQIDAAHPQSRYLLALLDEREQNLKEMFKNLKIAVDLDPTYIDARIKLGQLYFRGQGYEAALQQADAVLALDADNADGHTLRGGVFYYRGDTAAAIEEANLALASEPGHVGAISVLTEVYKGEDPTLALAAISEGLTLETDSATLKQLKITVLEEQGDADGVIAVYQELIADYPENLFFHYRLVKFLEQQGRMDEAEALLRDIIKTTPDNVQLKLWLAEFIARQRNLALAATTAQEFIEKQPDIYELRFALGTIYTAQGENEAAEAVYTEIITLDEEGTDALRARNELVKLQLARGATADAQVLLNEIVAIEPENTEALIAQARLEMAQGELSTAILHLRTVVRNEPTSLQALLLLGQAHEAAGSADLALDSYRNALAVDPANAQAVIKVAGLLIAEGEPAPADRLLEGFLVGNPTHPQASHLLAESYGRQGRWEDALAVANSLESSELNSPLGSYLKGRLLYAQKDYAGSLAAFTQVLALEPSAIEALEYLTRSYLALGRQEEAFTYLLKHIENYPDQPHARDLLGTLYMNTGQADKAIASYQAALAIAPERVSTLLALARAFQASGDLQSTLDTYDKALELAPNNVTFMTLKADLLVTMEQFPQAAEVYEAILAIDSRQKVAANNLAMLLVNRLPTEQGLQRALEITAGFEKTKIPTFWDTRGWVYYQLEDYESALPLQQRAVESDKVTNSFRYHLGMTYLKLNDTESAHAELEASLEDGVDYYGSEIARGVVQ